MLVTTQLQNRRQKVFNRGLCSSAEGLDIMKLTKIPRIYSVSRFNLGVLGALFGGLSQPKPPVATGLHSCQFKPQKFSIIF